TPSASRHRRRSRGGVHSLLASAIWVTSATQSGGLRGDHEDGVDRAVTDRQTPQSVTVIHVICDNLRMHKGKLVRTWLTKHPRFQFPFTPVHCSWMNQVEQWFGILHCKQLRIANFKDVHDLEAKIMLLIEQWNETAHPFEWTKQSFTKILAKVDAD